MKRRSFLKSSLISAATASALVSSKAFPSQSLASRSKPNGSSKYPCLQVFTDQSSSQFKISKDFSTPLYYRCLDPQGNILPLKILSQSKNPHNDDESVDHLYIDSLSINIQYRLQMSPLENFSTIDDERFFKALDVEKSRARWAYVSCMMDLSFFYSRSMWESLQKSNPDVIFFIGDACYADVLSHGTQAGFWRRHFEARRQLEIFYWKHLTPVISVWDDHDTGRNNTDQFHPFLKQAQEGFQVFFGSCPRPRMSLGPGVSSFVQLFGQKFCLMDDRSFRSPNEISKRNYWGQEQEDWFLHCLANDDLRPIWLINGNQFFGKYLEKESVEGQFPEALLSWTSNFQKKRSPVVFISGDIHFSELMKIEKEWLGFETYEITSSPMHSLKVGDGTRNLKNPRRKLATFENNFVIIDLKPSNRGLLHFSVQCLGKKQRVLFTSECTVQT